MFALKLAINIKDNLTYSQLCEYSTASIYIVLTIYTANEMGFKSSPGGFGNINSTFYCLGYDGYW